MNDIVTLGALIFCTIVLIAAGVVAIIYKEGK